MQKLRALRFQLLPKVPLGIPVHGGLFKILGPNGFLLGLPGFGHPLFQGTQGGREFHLPQPCPAGRLVHQIHCLVRKPAVGEIPDRQADRRCQRLVGNGQLMVAFIPPPKPFKDLLCLLRRRFGHGYRLKPPLESGIFFDIPPVLLGGGCPNDLQVATTQSGLQNVGGVDGPLGAACTHDGMKLIEKEDDVPRPPDLGQNVSHPFLKLSPVLGPCHHGGKV